MTKGKKTKKTIPKRYVFSEHVGEKPGPALEVVRVEAKPPLAQGGRTVCFCFLCQRVGFCVCEGQRGFCFILLFWRPANSGVKRLTMLSGTNRLTSTAQKSRTRVPTQGPKRGSERCFEITFINSSAVVLSLPHQAVGYRINDMISHNTHTLTRKLIRARAEQRASERERERVQIKVSGAGKHAAVQL